MRVDILRKLDQREKSLYWLAKETKVRYNTIYNLAHGRTSKVSFEILDKICFILNCSLEEILLTEKPEDLY